MTGRGVCRDSLLERARVEEEDLGRNFQPSGSWPVMTDVLTVGEEEQVRGAGKLQIPMAGQEKRLNDESFLGRDTPRSGVGGSFILFFTIMTEEPLHLQNSADQRC